MVILPDSCISIGITSLQVQDNKSNGGEGGIRTLDRVVRPYNGLAIAHKLAMHNVLKRLQSESGAPSRGPSLSIGTKCSPFCSPTLINQARRVGKHIGRPARRRLGRADIEKIGLL